MHTNATRGGGEGGPAVPRHTHTHNGPHHPHPHPGLQMEKTEKTMAEMEVDQNLAWEFSSITEKGRKLEPLAGPG